MIAGALFALALTSCNKSSEVPAPVLDDTLAIVVDGVLDEAVYGQMPERVTGVKAGVTVTYAASKEGVYFGLHVKDSNFQVSPSSGVVASDYVGIAVDAKAIPKGQDGVSEYTRLFRIDIMGRYTYTVGNEYGAWEDTTSGVYADPIEEEGEYRIAFTKTQNVDYNVELFFSWAHHGVTSELIETQNHLTIVTYERRTDTPNHITFATGV